MKKVLSLIIVCLIVFVGCANHESNPTNVCETEKENQAVESIACDANNKTAEAEQVQESEVVESIIWEEEEETESTEVEEKQIPDVVFVPTPQDVVEKMLEMVKVQKDDLVYDLGCGDGRIVVTAAKKYGCKAVGFDIDPQRVEESLENVAKNNVGDLVTIVRKDIFTLDLSEASVITLYLLPELNVRLIPQLKKLKPGSRIVSHDFSMRGVKPDEVVKLTSEQDNMEHTIYLWTTPLNMIEKYETTSEEEEW